MENWPEHIKKHFATVPFFKFLDAAVLQASHGQAKVKIPMRPEFANTYGIVHGGIVAALVDMAAGVALRTLKVRILTVETTADFLAPVLLKDQLVAEARLVQESRKLLHADVNVFNSQHELVARGKAIYYVRGEDDEKYYLRD